MTNSNGKVKVGAVTCNEVRKVRLRWATDPSEPFRLL